MVDSKEVAARDAGSWGEAQIQPAGRLGLRAKVGETEKRARRREGSERRWMSRAEQRSYFHQREAWRELRCESEVGTSLHSPLVQCIIMLHAAGLRIFDELLHTASRHTTSAAAHQRDAAAPYQNCRLHSIPPFARCTSLSSITSPLTVSRPSGICPRLLAFLRSPHSISSRFCYADVAPFLFFPPSLLCLP